ncbi:MAG: CHAD domain-containing protein [Bacteroidia bacterium]|nr:CHAD domain-containing protein [Bacteroidia bacterium]
MDENHLIQHYYRELGTFREHFAQTRAGLGRDDIHQLRVSIKKLRAILHLLELAGKGAWSTAGLLDLFAQLFKKAGKVREAQINLGLVENEAAECLGSYSKSQEKKLLHRKEKLHAQLEQFDFEKLDQLNQELSQNTKNLLNQTVFEEGTRFVEESLQEVDGLRKKIKDDEVLHDIRIKLKAVHEVLSILADLSPTEELLKFKAEIKMINELIGEWHDHTVLGSSIQEFDQEELNKKGRAELKKHLKALKQQNALNRRQIVAFLHEIISSRLPKPARARARKTHS